MAFHLSPSNMFRHNHSKRVYHAYIHLVSNLYHAYIHRSWASFCGYNHGRESEEDVRSDRNTCVSRQRLPSPCKPAAAEENEHLPIQEDVKFRLAHSTVPTVEELAMKSRPQYTECMAQGSVFLPVNSQSVHELVQLGRAS